MDVGTRTHTMALIMGIIFPGHFTTVVLSQVEKSFKMFLKKNRPYGGFTDQKLLHRSHLGQSYAQILKTGLSKIQKHVRITTVRKKESNLSKLQTCFSTCSSDTNTKIQ